MQKQIFLKTLLATAALAVVLGSAHPSLAGYPTVRQAPRPVVGVSPNLVQPGSTALPATDTTPSAPINVPSPDNMSDANSAPLVAAPAVAEQPKPLTAAALTPLTPKQQAVANTATTAAKAVKAAAASAVAAKDAEPKDEPALAVSNGSLRLPENTQVTAASIDKIFRTRRTLFLPFGQRMTVWEAPTGMCFLDESQYLEGQLIRQMRGGPDSRGHTGPLLVAVFADCLELAKLEALPQIQADGPNYGDDSNNEAPLLHQGTITWMTPKDKALGTTLVQYLDDREPVYTQEVRGMIDSNYKQSGGRQTAVLDGDMTSKMFMASPDQFHFDKRAHRTDTSVSLAFSSEAEVEYKKWDTVGVVGTSLVRGMPVQVSLSSTALKKADKTTHQLTETLDRFFAQNVTLNN